MTDKNTSQKPEETTGESSASVDFEAMFNSLNEPDGGTDPGDEEQTDEGATEGDEESSEPEASPTPEAQPATTTPSTEDTTDYQKKYYELLERQQAAAATPTSSGESSQPASQATPQPEPFGISQEQQAAIKEYAENWPEHVAGVEALLAKQEAELKNLMRGALTEFYQVIGTQLAPVQQSVAMSAADRLRTAVAAVHPDYETLQEPVGKWIAAMPETARKAYIDIAKSSSPQDLIFLFDAYKRANTQVPQVQPATNGQGKPEPTTDERSKAASSLATVRRRRAATPVAEPDANDFEAAWAEANR